MNARSAEMYFTEKIFKPSGIKCGVLLVIIRRNLL